ncbi:DNA-methyltransferase [Parasediminibacterium paludis]|uniref:Methyltransferase n=1 Tax=Parasediminibacterium paludis TaxID=908966 RepID=A0ABV8PY18_9BACT
MNLSTNDLESNIKRNKRTNTKASFILGDSNKELDVLIRKKKKFQLIMTSPPYNMGKEYEKNEPIETYLIEIENIISKLVQVLDDRGSICWQVGNYIDKKTKEMFPLDIFYYNIFKKYKLQLRNRIIWNFEHGLHSTKRFSGRYEVILWFTKSEDYTFNLDDVRVPAKYPGKKHYKGQKKGEISGNPLGKNPSDFWESLKNEWENAVWKIPNVKSNHKEKTIHPCQYPIELVERCVLALTNEGDNILDPYSGVGSSVLAAYKNKRNAIGIEKDSSYIDIANDRLLSLKKGQLKIRALGTPVHIPNQNQAVAKKPDHFKY